MTEEVSASEAAKKTAPVPISPDLLKQSEDKMKRNLMKVRDFECGRLELKWKLFTLFMTHFF